MFFFGWGSRSKTYALTDGHRQVVYQYTYVDVFFIFQVAWNEHWYLIGDRRDEDREIDFETATKLLPQQKRPRLGQWGRFGLLYSIAFLILLGLFTS